MKIIKTYKDIILAHPLTGMPAIHVADVESENKIEKLIIFNKKPEFIDMDLKPWSEDGQKCFKGWDIEGNYFKSQYFILRKPDPTELPILIISKIPHIDVYMEDNFYYLYTGAREDLKFNTLEEAIDYGNKLRKRHIEILQKNPRARVPITNKLGD